MLGQVLRDKEIFKPGNPAQAGWAGICFNIIELRPRKVIHARKLSYPTAWE